jgi:hypothetical protein
LPIEEQNPSPVSHGEEPNICVFKCKEKLIDRRKIEIQENNKTREGERRE